jgi:peptidoglycan hydrolase-like protein with peptidoglycan-binding domain
MIERSVGRDGANLRNDVLIIQNALTVCRARAGVGGITVDGLVGPETIAAITSYQRRNSLVTDGRVDAGGPTDRLLRSQLGQEAAVFALILVQLFQAYEPIVALADAAPRQARRFTDLGPWFKPLYRFSDLTDGLDGRPSVVLASFRTGPPVFGFAGADDAAAAIIAVLFVAALATMIIIMTQSPSFRKAVQVRAKELDRILGELNVHTQNAFQAAVNVIIAVTNDTVDQSNDCRKSPTFIPSPECLKEIQAFRAILQRIRNQVFELNQLIQLFLIGGGRGLSVHALRTTINNLINRARQNAVDLQVALANMKEKCKCPDI